MKMTAWLMLGLHKNAAEIIFVKSCLGADSKIVLLKDGRNVESPNLTKTAE